MTITDIGAEGNAVARVDNLVVFVPMLIPGDVVDLKVIRKRKKYLEGRLSGTIAIHPTGLNHDVVISGSAVDVNGSICLTIFSLCIKKSRLRTALPESAR